MADFAVSVALEVLKQTSTIVGELIVKEGSRLQEKIIWLETEMRYIQSYLKDVEDKQGDNEGVATLMRDIISLALDVEDIMEKYFSIQPTREGFKGFFRRIPHIFSDVYDARNILAEIESIRRRVKSLNRKRQTYDINGQHSEQAGGGDRQGWDERRSYPHVDEPNITGFEDHIQNLEAEINNKDPQLRVISITGMPGLGKTTLAKKVYNSVRRSFAITAWVYVSEQPNIKNILQSIALQVSLPEKERNNFEAELYEHLSRNRYVIVIDDIWDTRPWDAIKVAIPTNSQNGSRIILTSRDKEVGIYVGGRSSLFELQPLGESNCELLFETSIGLSQPENDPPSLKEIGKKILRKCGGVPLAIVVLAGLLKVKERSSSAWNGVLGQMDQSQGKLSKSFGLSYTDLPTNLKPCFLYFGLFPEDHEIRTFDLINMWAAEGFIKETKDSDVEDIGDFYLNHLIARNLVQVVRKDSNGKVKSCRIHDILRGICIQVSKDILFSTDLTNYNDAAVRRVTTYGMSMSKNVSSNRRTPKLRSFYASETMRIGIYLT